MSIVRYCMVMSLLLHKQILTRYFGIVDNNQLQSTKTRGLLSDVAYPHLREIRSCRDDLIFEREDGRQQKCLCRH